MKKFFNLRRAVRNFHEDEQGLEALQVVMILAIAAVCLILVKSKWTDIKSFFTDNVDKAVGDKNWPTS